MYINVKRESNIELLRIIAMWYILIHHLIVHAICPELVHGTGKLSCSYILYSFVEGFLYVAVDVFILVSGYFGIKLRAKKIWSLYLQCAFYGLLTYLFGVMVGTVPLVPHTIITKSVLIFSHLSSWWFVVCYLMLMIISPFLNFSMQKMSKKEYLFSLILFAFLQLYLGWFWQKSAYDTNGYSFINFIYVYLIGGYLRRFVSLDKLHQQRKISLMIYVLCALLFGVCNILRLCIHIPFGNLWGYNNPIIILGAISLFLYIRTFAIRSNVINIIGGGVFAAYLITDISYVGDWLYVQFGVLAQNINAILIQFLVILLTAIALLLLCCCIDIVRTWLMKPIINAFDGIDKKMNRDEK